MVIKKVSGISSLVGIFLGIFASISSILNDGFSLCSLVVIIAAIFSLVVILIKKFGWP